MNLFEYKREYPRTIAFRAASSKSGTPFATPDLLLQAIQMENATEATLIGFALVVMRLESDRALLDSLKPDANGWYRVDPFTGHSDETLDFLKDEAQIAAPPPESEEMETWMKKQSWH